MHTQRKRSPRSISQKNSDNNSLDNTYKKTLIGCSIILAACAIVSYWLTQYSINNQIKQFEKQFSLLEEYNRLSLKPILSFQVDMDLEYIDLNLHNHGKGPLVFGNIEYSKNNTITKNLTELVYPDPEQQLEILAEIYLREWEKAGLPIKDREKEKEKRIELFRANLVEGNVSLKRNTYADSTLFVRSGSVETILHINAPNSRTFTMQELDEMRLRFKDIYMKITYYDLYGNAYSKHYDLYKSLTR